MIIILRGDRQERRVADPRDLEAQDPRSAAGGVTHASVVVLGGAGRHVGLLVGRDHSVHA